MSWSPRRRGVWVVAAVLALASGVLKWWALERGLSPAPGPQGARVAPATGVAASLAAQAPASSVPAPSTAASTAGGLSPPVLSLTPRALRMQADWCGFGAAEAERDAAAERDSPGPTVAPAPTDGGQVLALAQQRVLQRWADTLRRRGDPRSLAVAAWVVAVGGPTPAERASSQARLQALAATSTDPLVTVLALDRPCEPGACTNIEASQWSRLEPENVQAWLKPGGTPGHAPDYMLERMATAARYSRSYQQEVGDQLLSLLQFDTPGLENQAESVLLNLMAAALPLPSFRPLTTACRTPDVDAVTRARCEVAAGLLWSQGSMIERAIALAVAGSAVPTHSAQRQVWEGRAMEYEAVSIHNDGRLARVLQELPDDASATRPCELLPQFRKWAREAVERTDWDRARAEFAASGADLNGLSRRWRSKQGRSALERPRQPVPAASAPG